MLPEVGEIQEPTRGNWSHILGNKYILGDRLEGPPLG